MNLKTLLIQLLCGALSLFTACSPGTGNTDRNPSETYKIHAYLDTIIQDWEGRDVFEEEFYNFTSTKLEITQPPHQQYMDKLFVAIASGKVPDICEILPEFLPTFVDDNLVLPLDELIAESENAWKVPNELIESLRYSDGRIYGFPARDGGGNVLYVRKDWLDNLGLNIPRTWDELLTVLRAFTTDDPDGNGLDDTYGITDMHASSRDWYNRTVFLDGRVEIYHNGSRWVDGFTMPSTTAALERLKALYDEGLMDPDFLTNTTHTARTKFFNGEVGMISYWANHWARNLLERTRATMGPGVEVVPVPAIDGAVYIRRISPLLVITRSSSNPGLVFEKFIDAQYDESKVQQLFTYGVEGFHWEDIGGEIEFLSNVEDPYQAPFTKAFVPPNAVLNDWDQPMQLDPLVQPALDILNDSPYQEILRIGGEYYNRYFEEIETVLKPEIITRIVLGEYEIEEGMNIYSRRAEELFLAAILKELNAAVPAP